MKLYQIYSSRSKACSSVKVGRYYVFEDHIVYRTNDGTFAIAHQSLESNVHLNAVDGFIAFKSSIKTELEITYCFIGEISNDDLKRVRALLGRLK